MPRFLDTVTPDEARAVLAGFPRVAGSDLVPLADALGRVLAEELVVPESLPAFDRSLMDGYAVRARDTFGASESAPAYLALSGRIAMGSAGSKACAEGTAQEISTGGALPSGADAVVMVEYCREVGDGQVEIARPVAASENVIRAGDDLSLGAPLLGSGLRLRPQEIMALAALGVTSVRVCPRPKVGILSSGDELVEPGRAPLPGQVRDCNALALLSQVTEAGGAGRLYGVCSDDPAALAKIAARMRDECDAAFVSGGSSQGVRDSTAEILAGFGPPGILAHGIAIAPGKPTILAASGGKPLIGLPGHPVSALVIARVFLNPLVRSLGGETGLLEPFPRRTRARLSRPVASKPGREDYVRVRLAGDLAEPLLKGSGALSTVLLADGLVRIPLDCEGLLAGEEVDVLVF
jgi:molybdopterin molybdotransferase